MDGYESDHTFTHRRGKNHQSKLTPIHINHITTQVDRTFFFKSLKRVIPRAYPRVAVVHGISSSCNRGDYDLHTQ